MKYKCDGTFYENTKKQNSPESVALKPVNILKNKVSSGDSSVADGILFSAMKRFPPPRLV